MWVFWARLRIFRKKTAKPTKRDIMIASSVRMPHRAAFSCTPPGLPMHELQALTAVWLRKKKAMAADAMDMMIFLPALMLVPGMINYTSTLDQIPDWLIHLLKCLDRQCVRSPSWVLEEISIATVMAIWSLHITILFKGKELCLFIWVHHQGFRVLLHGWSKEMRWSIGESVVQVMLMAMDATT